MYADLQRRHEETLDQQNIGTTELPAMDVTDDLNEDPEVDGGDDSDLERSTMPSQLVTDAEDLIDEEIEVDDDDTAGEIIDEEEEEEIMDDDDDEDEFVEEDTVVEPTSKKEKVFNKNHDLWFMHDRSINVSEGHGKGQEALQRFIPE